MTCCSAKARPADISPKAVASRAGSLNQIDSRPRMSTIAASRLMAWRVQNFVCTRRGRSCRARGRRRRARGAPPTRTTAMNAIERRSLRPFSALTPTQSMPRRCNRFSDNWFDRTNCQSR